MKSETKGSITETVARMAMAGMPAAVVQETQRVMLEKKTESLADWCNEWQAIDKFYMVFALEMAYIGLREMLTEEEQELLKGLKELLGAAVVATPHEEGD